MTHSSSTFQTSAGLLPAITGTLLFFIIPGDVLGAGVYALMGVLAAKVDGAPWHRCCRPS